jgi:hypothetical protein
MVNQEASSSRQVLMEKISQLYCIANFTAIYQPLLHQLVWLQRIIPLDWSD